MRGGMGDWIAGTFEDVTCLLIIQHQGGVFGVTDSLLHPPLPDDLSAPLLLFSSGRPGISVSFSWRATHTCMLGHIHNTDSVAGWAVSGWGFFSFVPCSVGWR